MEKCRLQKRFSNISWTAGATLFYVVSNRKSPGGGSLRRWSVKMEFLAFFQRSLRAKLFMIITAYFNFAFIKYVTERSVVNYISCLTAKNIYILINFYLKVSENRSFTKTTFKNTIVSQFPRLRSSATLVSTPSTDPPTLTTRPSSPSRPATASRPKGSPWLSSTVLSDCYLFIYFYNNKRH